MTNGRHDSSVVGISGSEVVQYNLQRMKMTTGSTRSSKAKDVFDKKHQAYLEYLLYIEKYDAVNTNDDVCTVEV